MRTLPWLSGFAASATATGIERTGSCRTKRYAPCRVPQIHMPSPRSLLQPAYGNPSTVAFSSTTMRTTSLFGLNWRHGRPCGQQSAASAEARRKQDASKTQARRKQIASIRRANLNQKSSPIPYPIP